MNQKYRLELWPDSQPYIGKEDCFFYNTNSDGEFDFNLSQAVFVPDENGTFIAVYDPQFEQEGLIGTSWNDEDESYTFIET